MMRYPFNTVTGILLPLILLTFTSCSSAPKVEKATVVDYRSGVAGGTLVETYKLNVTVASIDAASRRLTLVAPDRSRNTFTAAPGDRAFDRLKSGEQIQVTVTRQLVVFLRKNGAPLNENPAIADAMAQDSGEKDIAKSDTVERIGKVGAVDLQQRQATLEMPDGTSRTFAARKDVDLTQVKPGEEVVIRTTSAVVLPANQP